MLYRAEMLDCPLLFSSSKATALERVCVGGDRSVEARPTAERHGRRREEAPTGGPRPSALEEYKKRIEETRRQLETSRAIGRESRLEPARRGSAAPAAPPRTTAEGSTRRPSFSGPLPLLREVRALLRRPGRNPNPSRTPRPSFAGAA